ncbi:MAG TPA: hypothetical protein VEV17_00170 [Bryobacteraceae bacterium]|nr:hypothetical protein [Bryobacteraceae bacterium]
MTRVRSGWFAVLSGVFAYAAAAYAVDIGGPISSTLVITEDSQLVDDVTCTVTGAACIAIGAPNITLELNGFTITGPADSQTPCNVGPVAGEAGIEVNTQTGVTIHGPGLVQQFRGSGIHLITTTGARVVGAMMSTNCMSGILVNAGSGNELDNNVSVRNGVPGGGCGGI